MLSLMSILTVNAQGFGYDSKTEIGNGLYKVKSGQCYGIIDDEDNVVVSVEYQDILYRQGKALLTKDNILYGVVDSLGKVKSFEPKYKIHPQFKYIYDGHIIVGDSKWGYLSEDGEPLFFNTKSMGAFIFRKKSFMVFDDVYPFIDGLATVFLKKTGWRHIDKTGKERFVLNNKKAVSEFRSSVYKMNALLLRMKALNNTKRMMKDTPWSNGFYQHRHLEEEIVRVFQPGRYSMTRVRLYWTL